MITVSYVLSDDPLLLREQGRVNLGKAELVDLCYSCFGGDLTLKVNDVDLSIVTGGGVQILDFAVGFFSAGRTLASGENARIDFAGLADEIHLVPSGDSVRVVANYVDGSTEVPRAELVSASRKFLTEVLMDLGGRHPDLRRNKNLKKVYAWVGLRP
ncbi:hypothetical protein PV379_33185 [Streptomyces caniscabiei]|uniref:hypothetical protein n=1 Tax=Streptomyces caniscabiei TaxID=2746961 RepID=UPI0029B3E60C|nr:hypothetical protein [Streptomyces caniscabiei]MDX2601302.1 hypothetical protein [Streptomyces caniscabiei]MDX2738882.1 hypothetical protein [Streptomyces caniscabiei]MDX2782119.1 hypothetical protein [Streptomyces caniscabiei]